MQEHLDGDCEIQVNKDEDRLLRVRLKSRHVSSRSYLMWILYMFASNVKYVVFRFAKHQNLSYFGVRNWGSSVSDAAAVVEPIDASYSDDDDEEDVENTDIAENEQ